MAPLWPDVGNICIAVCAEGGGVTWIPLTDEVIVHAPHVPGFDLRQAGGCRIDPDFVALLVERGVDPTRLWVGTVSVSSQVSELPAITTALRVAGLPLEVTMASAGASLMGTCRRLAVRRRAPSP